MKHYTGVGSRETPNEILVLMKDIAEWLFLKGYTLRSGGADGADTAFESGAHRQCEIYIPWDGFNSLPSTEEYICLRDMMNADKAKEIAESVHPAWDRLSSGAKSLHTRNTYQVLGMDLQSPSKFLICYSKPQGKSISGGTRTAWEIAKQFGIPCFNLYRDEDRARIEDKVYGD